MQGLKPRSILTLLFVCTAFCAAHGQTRDSIRSSRGEQIVYTYTPLDSLDKPQPKPSFLRRIVDYFDKANEDKTYVKKIDFSIILGPSYTKNTSVSLGVLAAGLYRLDRTDSITPPSDISIYGNVSITGFYSLGVRGNNIFRDGRNRIDYRIGMESKPTDFWGTGFDAGAHNAAGSFIEKQVKIEGRYLYRLFKNTYVGGKINMQYSKGVNFSDLACAYLNGERTSYTAAGVGAVIEYDTRDFIPNAWRGCYLSFQEMISPRGTNNCGHTLWRTTFTANYYHTLWKGGVVATDLYAEFNSRGTPWPMLARLGDSNRMRGYYEGRYMDNDIVAFQVEIRQHIWRRIGATAWGGAGNVFPSFGEFRWSHTLPNYGIGLRWEFKHRVNVRVDYGFGRHTSGLVFNINEAF